MRKLSDHLFTETHDFTSW